MAETAEQPQDTNVADDDGSSQQYNIRSFRPLLYVFRVPSNSEYEYALQQPFAELFDNLISVLWVTYSKRPTIKIGISQIQWALGFMKCMRVDNRYPESIGRIVEELEKRLIELYAKVGEKLHEIRTQQELDDERESQFTNSKIVAEEIKLADCYRVSYNERDILKKLYSIDVPIDPATGEAKSLKELNALGSRRPNIDEMCRASSKTLLIGALQNIKTKTKDVTTKTDVDVLIKDLEIRSSPSEKSKQKSRKQ